jgi:hypothetical protein
MDNLFEILIYLFIIISFLSSLFKKKEEPKPPKTQQSKSQKSIDEFTEYEIESLESKTESYDILSELENIFNQDLGTPKQKQETPRVFKGEIKPDSLEQESINYDKFDLERKIALETQSRFQRKEIIIDDKTERAAQMFEEMLFNQRAKAQVVHPLIKKIKDRKLIKDYIIISEILQKPLALRK